MKIKDISVFFASAVWRNFVIIEVSTDDGITGYGEGTMGDFEKTIESAVNDFKPHLIGMEVDIPKILNFLYRNFFWRGGPILMTAISAIEQALWDINGKSAGKPVYRLLGGKAVDKVRTYANGYVSGSASPQQFGAETQKVVSAGFTAVKIDPFGGSGPFVSQTALEACLSRVKAIRDFVGYQIDVMIEAHGRFNVTTAIKIAEALHRYEPFWLEEPVPEEDISSMAYVKSRSPIPIATGERIVSRYRYKELFDLRAADIVQPDVCHVGGIKALTEIGSMAETHYVPVAPHNPNGPIATAATLNALVTMPNSLILEFWLDAETVRRDLLKSKFDLRDGNLYPDERPGLGIEVNEEALEKYPYRKMHLEYFSDTYRYHGDAVPSRGT